MNYREEIEKFVVDGYKNVCTISYLRECIFNRSKMPLETDGKHSFVLKNREDNFITTPEKNFKFHKWAGSLKSSQAFAYNIFSGVKDREFEFSMEVFDRPAQIDVKIEDVETQTIELFEVKMFEVINKEKIEFEGKYDDKAKYIYLSEDVVDAFIKFKNEVINHFDGQKIYGGGIKQLCSHLLGILNIMNKPEYENKKIKLHSLCFDVAFSDKFGQDIDNYRETLTMFKCLVDKFLKEIKVDSRIEYCGFLSAIGYVVCEAKKELLGKENYEYVMERYLYKKNENPPHFRHTQ
ncbi:MAG: hypothetical protein FWC10_10185 [Lentimicrobiaceae bacterium]|nr:hypothetical protein [Lentimicrobiaceae bacterium]